jgi:hypothetical protein
MASLHRRIRVLPRVSDGGATDHAGTLGSMTTTTAAAPGSPTPAARQRRLAGTLDRFDVLVGLALTAQLVVLLPVLSTAFWEDDAANSYIVGYLRFIGRHFWPFVWTSNKLQVDHFGRPMPLGVLQTYGVFELIHDRFVYKLLLIALTLLASWMLALVLRRMGLPAAFCALAALLPAAVWQLHLLHDPLVSYVGLVQTITIYTCGSALALLSWLRRGGHWRLAVVALLTACSCVTYEAGYLLPSALVLVAWHERRCSLRRALVLSLPGTGVAAAFLATAVALQHSLPKTSGYSAAFTSPSAIATAWAKIITSGLPVSGWLVHPGPGDTPPTTSLGPWLIAVVVAIVLFLVLTSLRRSSATAWTRNRRSVLTVVGIAAVIILTPSALTAVSPQYQQQLVWGWGYLPMFLAGLGWATLAALALASAFARLARHPMVAAALAAAVAVTAGVATGLNAEANVRISNFMTPVWRSRQMIESGFRHGVLSDVPTFSTVLWYQPDITVPQGPWPGGAFNFGAWTRAFVNRPLTMHLISPTAPGALVCTDASGAPTGCALLKSPTFWIRTVTRGSRGYVAVVQAAPDRWGPKQDTLTSAAAPGTRPTVYVHDPRINAGSGGLPFRVVLSRVTRSSQTTPETVGADHLRVLSRGAGWTLVRLPAQPRFVAASIGVRFSERPAS